MTIRSAVRMSTPDVSLLADRLTRDRLSSYLSSTAGDLRSAIALYDWNLGAAAAMYEDLGRLEVVFRNAVDQALVRHGATESWRTSWYRQSHLFPGRRTSRARADIHGARQRATRGGQRGEMHGRVIAELNFGFWRFLYEASYHTSMWVPCLAAVLPGHPASHDARQVRADVARRMRRFHALRNRIAHHEPIHQWDLAREHGHLLEVIGWICSRTRDWAETASRTQQVLASRPRRSHEQSAQQG